MTQNKRPLAETVLGLGSGPSCAGCGRPLAAEEPAPDQCPACGVSREPPTLTRPAPGQTVSQDQTAHVEPSAGDPFAPILAHPDLRERYEIGAKLGQGGMGAVFEARDRRLKRRVALKLILHATPDRIARFQREGEVLAALSHPGIRTIHAAEVVGTTPVLVMELLEGRTLKADLARTGWYEPACAVELALDILDGLAAAHLKGVVHRDLKSENILLVEPDGVKILDFGLAHQMEEISPGSAGLTGRGAIMGTPSYMSPEQCQGRAIDARSDIYALGVVLFEMLTGSLPFTGSYAAEILLKHIEEAPPRLVPLVAGLPMDLERVVMTALRKRPEERYLDAGTMACALREVPVGRPARRPGSRPGEPREKSRSSRAARGLQGAMRSRPDIQAEALPKIVGLTRHAPWLALGVSLIVLVGILATRHLHRARLPLGSGFAVRRKGSGCSVRASGAGASPRSRLAARYMPQTAHSVSWNRPR